jgi:LacI family transcriptional regulator
MLIPQTVWPAIEERKQGILKVVRQHRTTVTIEILACGDASYDGVQRALDAFMRRSDVVPDAVIAANDQMGIAALKFFRAAGRRVPEDVMITGFNGFEFRMHTDPILTTVKSAAYELGALGGAALIARIQSGKFAGQDITLPVALEIGGTT